MHAIHTYMQITRDLKSHVQALAACVRPLSVHLSEGPNHLNLTVRPDCEAFSFVPLCLPFSRCPVPGGRSL